jgi:hypothetical protein
MIDCVAYGVELVRPGRLEQMMLGLRPVEVEVGATLSLP